MAPIATTGSLYFIVSLPGPTIIRFVIWNAIGVVVYLCYGRKKSLLAQRP